MACLTISLCLSARNVNMIFITIILALLSVLLSIQEIYL